LRFFKKHLQPDHRKPCAPYFLKAENLFARSGEREIFLKKIYSVSPMIPKLGSIVMAPGIACNANLFRISEKGDILGMNHNQSFANYLATQGFEVYLYHPGYSERTHNRYVSKHCKESIWYGKKYKVPSNLSFVELVELELPLVIDFVTEHSKQKYISWIGFSMGGMLIYSYLSKHKALNIKNVITIGSPLSLSQIFIRIIPYTNMASKALGFEETKFLGTLTENLVPMTRLIRVLPAWVLRYNLLSLLLF
ncbi:MAG: alpha/beta fold hydrolase, partial [Desulfobacteraceae bacterium]|nr:alpha/beta fold hydrolase [Desulfobacteraceae bacterium]